MPPKTAPKITKRESSAIINSLTSGVVPRVGLRHIAVGRKDQVAALLHDIDSVTQGASSFRFIVGRYGSGKSFMMQLMRNRAMDKGLVVADSDLSLERRLTGSQGQGLATYNELMKNLSIKTRPDGGALAALLEEWISRIQCDVSKAGADRTDSDAFDRAVRAKIEDEVKEIKGMVHAFDFATVIHAYWKGYHASDQSLQDAALKWLRGEFTTKTEAKQKLNVRVIIDQSNWHDYLKLMASFVSTIGYNGLLVLLDEAATLLRIPLKAARDSNYEKLLSIFNDTMQGKVEHFGIIMAGTPQFIEDDVRGLYSYEALRTRIAPSRYLEADSGAVSGPVIRLARLTNEELFLLMRLLAGVYSVHYSTEKRITDKEIEAFMRAELKSLGSEKYLSPRECIRDFITVSDMARTAGLESILEIVQADDFKATPETHPREEGEADPFSGFTL